MRKNILSIITVLLCPTASYADLIVTTDGRTITAYNIDLGNKYVTYTQTESIDGTVMRLPIDQCFGVKIGDNPIQAVQQAQQTSVVQSQPQVSTGPVYVEPVVAADNQQLIDYYNSLDIYHPEKQPDLKKIKKTDDGIFILGITPESILSDENISISFELSLNYNRLEPDFGKIVQFGEPYTGFRPTYKIKLKNKTKRNIYIDVANSFRIDTDGNAESYLNNMTVTHNSGGNTGGGINLGAVAGALNVGGLVGTLASGINVGGGKSNSTSITETENPVLVIPPGATVTMPQKIYTNDKGDKTTKNYDFFCPGFSWAIGENTKIQKWEMINLGNRLTDQCISRIITYSTSPDFKQYTALRFSLYTRKVYGTPSICEIEYLQNIKKGLWYFIR